MAKYLKKFNTHSEYNDFINGENKILPNISYCIDENDSHFNKFVETKTVAIYTVTDASTPTKLYAYQPNSMYGSVVIGVDLFHTIEIDGNEISISDIDSDNGNYNLGAGTHVVKYDFKNKTQIPNSVFDGCSNLTGIKLLDGITSIGINSFRACHITDITIPNTVTIIKDMAFNGTRIANLVIPDSVTTINTSAFASNSFLTDVTIGSGVTTIENLAFGSCGRIASVFVKPTTVPSMNGDAFSGSNTGLRIYVPAQSLNNYKAQSGWNNYASKIEAMPE